MRRVLPRGARRRAASTESSRSRSGLTPKGVFFTWVRSSRGSGRVQHGSAKQVILVLAVVVWIAVAVAGAFIAAFVNNLEVTVACATMATCVTASLWVYLALLELRQHYRANSDAA